MIFDPIGFTSTKSLKTLWIVFRVKFDLLFNWFLFFFYNSIRKIINFQAYIQFFFFLFSFLKKSRLTLEKSWKIPCFKHENDKTFSINQSVAFKRSNEECWLAWLVFELEFGKTTCVIEVWSFTYKRSCLMVVWFCLEVSLYLH